MDIKQFLAPIVGLNVADVVSAIQKLVLANLSPRKRGAGIQFTQWRVNRSLHPQLKEVTMGILKKLLAPIVGQNPAGALSAAKTQSLLLTFTLMVAAFWVSPAAVATEKKMVTDPSTGKMVTAPEYGGTITFALSREWPGPDHVAQGGGAHNTAGVVVEKLGIADWAIHRDKFSFGVYELLPPANTTGALAESWDISPDGLTYTFHIRQGVHWHKKTPMNGRSLTAKDIEYNFHRLLGMGSGFAEKSPNASSFKGWDLESITATDKSTVVFKLKEPRLSALASILDDWAARIYPPEVIKEHGDVTDWRNLVGTGPMMLTDWTKDSSVTWVKNPDYWGHDEKYPGNRLPYIDQLRSLTMPEVATQLAALRTGKVDYIGSLGGSQLKTIDQVESLQRTNPDIVIWPFAFRNDNAYGMNVQIKPFDDIRVRKAIQMAINIEEINSAYYKGYADTIPQGMLSRSSKAVIQFEDWPEDVKKVFNYDPEGAEALLDEAGYLRGADGIRFKTELMHLATDLNYAQLVASYWGKIGVEVEISVEEVPANWSARRKARDFEMMNTESAWWGDPLGPGTKRYTPGAHWNSSNVDDPFYTAKFEAAETAATLEEQYRLVRELNQYGIEKFWSIYTPGAPQYTAVQPWIIGFNGESWMGNGQILSIFTRLWIDQDLKKKMGY